MEQRPTTVYSVGQARELRHVVAWLPTLRGITCVALWAGLAAGWLLAHLELSLHAVAPAGLAAAICRTLVLAAERRTGSVPRPLAGSSLVADVALLTVLVDLTGGPFNPFIAMFPVYVWLAFATVSGSWAVAVGAAASASFGWLVVDHLQAIGASHHRLNDLPTHLYAMWLSGVAVAELMGHYVGRAEAALAQRQRLLDEARERAARTERLASLTTLAAGAAHELSTPLATIAVAARELEHSARRDGARAAADDARLIRTEVDRCQVILDRMSGRARDAAPASVAPLAPDAIASLAAAGLSEAQRARLLIEIDAETAPPSAAGTEAAQALSSLLRNAFDASPDSEIVRLRMFQHQAMIRIEVHDRGCGLSEEVGRRAGEPFFTTKEPGRGLGLGLFLARTFAERAGGAVRLETGAGTVAILELPAADVQAVPA